MIISIHENSINDPITCIYTNEKFISCGFASGQVILCSKNNKDNFDYIVLTKRSEEAIKSIYINETDHTLYACAGDVAIKRWDLNNLILAKPIIMGAEFVNIPLNIYHTYNNCSKTFILQDCLNILYLTYGLPKMHKVKLPEHFLDYKKEYLNSEAKRLRENELKGIKEKVIVRKGSDELVNEDNEQKKIKLAFPNLDITPYDFSNGKYILWLRNLTQEGGWNIVINDIETCKVFKEIKIKYSDSPKQHPWGFSLNNNVAIGIVHGNVVRVYNVLTRSCILIIKPETQRSNIAAVKVRFNDPNDPIEILTISSKGHVELNVIKNHDLTNNNAEFKVSETKKVKIPKTKFVIGLPYFIDFYGNEEFCYNDDTGIYFAKF